VTGLQTQTTERDVANLSFLSAAFPLEHGTLAIYRHELANFEAGYASNGPFTQTFGTGGPTPSVGRVQPTINDVDLQIVDYGFAGSWRIGSKFMIGGSLNYYRFDFDTSTKRFTLDGNHDGTISLQERLTTLDYSDASLFGISTQKGSDGDFGFNLGMLWQPTDKWSIGAVYRRGPQFDYKFAAYRIGTPAPFLEGTTDFVVPDVWAIGLGYKPSDAWRISFDAARVTYSDHAEHVVAQSFVGDIDYLTLNDVTELRFGAEYTAINAKRPFFLRFGMWHEPDHQMYFDGDVVPYTGTPLTPLENEKNSHAAMFVRGEDSMHYTAGYGMAFDKFQLDAAVDLSDRADVFSLSLVYFFN
jgi:hypothetical protein